MLFYVCMKIHRNLGLGCKELFMEMHLKLNYRIPTSEKRALRWDMKT
jgi:hypothetical protein